MTDAHGRPCIEAKTTADLEDALGMTAGNIFHGALRWPFAEDDEPLDTPARRWGVATAHDRILLCGSGSRRGGAVSGIGGHNAAMAVLESSGTPRPAALQPAAQLGRASVDVRASRSSASAQRGERARRRIVDVVDARDHATALVGQRDHLAPPVGRIGLAHHQSAVLQVVDRDGGGGRVHGGGLGDLLGRHRPLGQPAQHPDPAERQPGGVDDVALPARRGCRTPRRPWRARPRRRAWSSADIGAPPSASALPGDQRGQPLGRPQRPRRRREEAEHGDDDAEPDAHEPQRPGRRRRSRRRCCDSADPAIEPHSATPMLTPICRLVDVTADAAPARSSGIPLTAALVIGRVDHREADAEHREDDQQSPHRRGRRSGRSAAPTRW